VVALETEAMQPCLALPRHHPQHYDMSVTTCENKRYMSKPLTSKINLVNKCIVNFHPHLGLDS
jgi:hypothetical protein